MGRGRLDSASASSFLLTPIRRSSGRLRVRKAWPPSSPSLRHLPPSWRFAPKGEGSCRMLKVARRNAGLVFILPSGLGACCNRPLIWRILPF